MSGADLKVSFSSSSSYVMGGPFGGGGVVRPPSYADRAAHHLQLPLLTSMGGDLSHHPGVSSAGRPRMSRGPLSKARKAWGRPVGLFFQSEA